MIAKELRKIRKDVFELTQKEFAHKLGVSRGLIQYLEAAKRPVPANIEKHLNLLLEKENKAGKSYNYAGIALEKQTKDGVEK